MPPNWCETLWHPVNSVASRNSGAFLVIVIAVVYGPTRGRRINSFCLLQCFLSYSWWCHILHYLFFAEFKCLGVLQACSYVLYILVYQQFRFVNADAWRYKRGPSKICLEGCIMLLLGSLHFLTKCKGLLRPLRIHSEVVIVVSTSESSICKKCRKLFHDMSQWCPTWKNNNRCCPTVVAMRVMKHYVCSHTLKKTLYNGYCRKENAPILLSQFRLTNGLPTSPPYFE